MSNANAVAAVENFWREVWQPPQNPDAIDRLVAEDFALTSGGIDFVSRATFKKWVIDFQSKITPLADERARASGSSRRGCWFRNRC
jgi:hypothetical protein